MSEPSDREPCSSCGVLVPKTEDGYMLSSPGCWAVYGEVLAREYERPACAASHRLTVDAYTVQHPGGATPAETSTSSGWSHPGRSEKSRWPTSTRPTIPSHTSPLSSGGLAPSGRRGHGSRGRESPGGVLGLTG